MALVLVLAMALLCKWGMVLTGWRESGTLVPRDMALLCLAGEALVRLAGKALLFLRVIALLSL